MTPGLPEEELQRVGRRLPRDLERSRWLRSGCRDLVRQQLDATRLELAVDGVQLERVEAQLLAELVELGLSNAAAFLGHVEQYTQVVAEKQDVRGHAWCL